FFFQAEDGIRDFHVTGVQTCALPIWRAAGSGGHQPGGARRWIGAGAKPYRLGRNGAGRHLRDSYARRRRLRTAMKKARETRAFRSEERRVGREWRSGEWVVDREKENM